MIPAMDIHHTIINIKNIVHFLKNLDLKIESNEGDLNSENKLFYLIFMAHYKVLTI